MTPAEIKEVCLNKYLIFGEDRFYRFLINYATTRIISNDNKGISPELELMDYHDTFIALFRKEGNDNYLKIAKLFRRAAHRTYKSLLKQGKSKHSERFLNVVQ